MTLLSDISARVPAFLKTRGGALAVIAALQLGVLTYIVADRITLLKTGREIVLPIVPVDPRDLFKGDYVRLAYPVSTLPADMAGAKDKPTRTPIYVTLQPAPDGTWSAAAATQTYPAQVPQGHVVLRGIREIETWRATAPVRVRYGLERYYVPEGTGPALEQLARDKKLAAIVAVDRKGIAAIKGLSADGVKIYDEPLF
jgi:uncharacterized membrane-anchored protein